MEYNMEDIYEGLGDLKDWGPLSFQESQESMQVYNQEAFAPSSYESFSNPQPILDAFSFGVDGIQHVDQPAMLIDGSKDESMNYSTVNMEFSSNNRAGERGLVDRSTEKMEQICRMKWTDEMVKVLINAVSYVGEDALSDGPENEKFLGPKKGKWKAISATMAQRGYCVSRQQCEDKFNDLNRRYRRLNDVLGTDTACDVIEKPELIERMNILDEAKKEVKKILNCKQLFYREMFLYHNRNRNFLPHDVALLQSAQSALKGKLKCRSQNLIVGPPAKKREHEDEGFSSGANAHLPRKELLKQILELEKEKLEWVKSCQQKNVELQKVKLELEVTKLENKRLECELACRERNDARN